MNTAQNKTAVTGEGTASRVEDLIDELRLSETVEGEAVRYLLAKLTSIRCKLSDVIGQRDELLVAVKTACDWCKRSAPAYVCMGEAEKVLQAAIANAERGKQ